MERFTQTLSDPDRADRLGIAITGAVGPLPVEEESSGDALAIRIGGEPGGGVGWYVPAGTVVLGAGEPCYSLSAGLRAGRRDAVPECLPNC
jgi:hypothetical protein